jgi:hypothetical protein
MFELIFNMRRSRNTSTAAFKVDGNGMSGISSPKKFQGRVPARPKSRRHVSME